jgi:hypothetical protein
VLSISLDDIHYNAFFFLDRDDGIAQVKCTRLAAFHLCADRFDSEPGKYPSLPRTGKRDVGF